MVLLIQMVHWLFTEQKVFFGGIHSSGEGCNGTLGLFTRQEASRTAIVTIRSHTLKAYIALLEGNYQS